MLLPVLFVLPQARVHSCQILISGLNPIDATPTRQYVMSAFFAMTSRPMTLDYVAEIKKWIVRLFPISFQSLIDVIEMIKEPPFYDHPYRKDYRY